MKDTKNLVREEAIDKLKSLVSDISICLFRSNLLAEEVSNCGPMTAQRVCDQGNIWFFSEKNSDKNNAILTNSKVQLYFSNPTTGTCLVLNGDAEVDLTQSKIEELWTPLIKNWFPLGKEDPNISVIKVAPTSAYYWDTDSIRMISFLRLAASMAISSNLVTGRQGTLSING